MIFLLIFDLCAGLVYGKRQVLEPARLERHLSAQGGGRTCPRPPLSQLLGKENVSRSLPLPSS